MSKLSRFSLSALAVVLMFGLIAPSVSAAISYGSVSSAANSSSGATTLVLAKPSSTASGDFLIAGITFNDGSDVSTITPPSGWTLIERTDNEDKIGIATYYKVAGSSEGSDYTWTLSSSERAVGGIIRYTGVDTSGPIDVTGDNEGNTDDPIAISVDTTQANEMIVLFFGVDDDETFGNPISTTERFDTTNTDSSGPAIAAFDFAQASAAATGDKTSENSDSDSTRWVAQTIALKPALTAQTITVTTNAPANATYNSTFPVAATASSGLTVAITTTGGCSINAGTVTMTSGTTSCVVHYNQAGNGSYSAAPELTDTVIAEKADTTTVVSCSGPVEYDSDPQTPCSASVTGTGLSLSSLVPTYTNNVNAGTATAEYEYAGDDNYNASSDSEEFTISARAITVTADDKSKIYDTSDPELTYDISADLSGDDEFTGALTREEGEDVGEYDILQGDLSAGSNYDITYENATFEITPADAPITIGNLDQDYNGSPRSVTVTTNPTELGYSITYTGTGDTTYGPSSDAPTNAGTYEVTVEIDDENYTGSDSDTLTIDKVNADIDVTGYDVTYNDEAHTATGGATGVNDEELSGLDLSGTTHTNAGSYEDEWTFTDTTGNYNDASGSVESTIAQADATVVVTGYTVTFDGEPHTATGSATGVGEDGTLDGLNLSGTTHTEIGVYEDEWTFDGGTNYLDEDGVVTNTISSEEQEEQEEGTTYTFTYAPGANGTLSGDLSQVVNEGADGTHVNAVANSGFYFDNWSDGSRSNPRIDENAEANVSVTANFLPINSQRGGGGRGGGGSTGGGQVLGATTDNTDDTVFCSANLLITKTLRRGMNDAEVVKLQTFLNGEVGSTLPATSFFGPLTEAAVNTFQTKYASEILAPWGLTLPTGIVGSFTQYKINTLVCASIGATNDLTVPTAN